MSSTLRSLVLRYKADIKDFQKGNRKVIDDVKRSKKDVEDLGRSLHKTFAPKMERIKSEIKSLNKQFIDGKMDVKNYGNAVDQLKQKLSSLNRTMSIAVSEVNAKRDARLRQAFMERDLRRSFGGTPGGMSTSMMLADFEQQRRFRQQPVPEQPARGRDSSFLGSGIGRAAAAWMTYGVAKRAWTLVEREAGSMASGRMGTSERVAGEVVGRTMRNAREAVTIGAPNLFARMAGAIPDMLTGGSFARTAGIERDTAAARQRSNEIAARTRARDAAMAPQMEFDEALRQQREIEQLAQRRSTKGLEEAQHAAYLARDYEKVRTLSLAIVAIKERNIDMIAREKAMEDAKRASIAGMVGDLIQQRQMLELTAGGMSEAAAAVKLAGGTEADIENAAFVAKQIEKLQREREMRSRPITGNWLDASGDAAASAFARARQQAQSVAAFRDQFATPQEVFAKNLREIQSMMSLGLDPAVAHRAMMANAQGLARSGGRFDRFAPAAEVGSREEMAMREQAKAQGKQEKKINELVEIQKQALKVAKEKGEPVKIEVTEVSF